MKIIKGITVIFLLLFFAVNAHAVRVKQVNLEVMAGSAKLVFEGECISKEIEFDKEIGQDIYAFTFRVDRVLKGDPGSTHVVKVLKALADQKQVTTFIKGEKLILFMLGESRLGLSSPVGLGQGRFSVVDLDGGKKGVINENRNRGLLKNVTGSMKMRALSGEESSFIKEDVPADYDTFISLTESLIGQ